MYNHYKEKILNKHQKIARAGVIDTMFYSPVRSPVSLGERIGVHYTTATRYLSELKDSGFLVDLNYGKYHLFINKALLDIIQE
ncbi:hypothetical protein P3G55_22285 [Leptospira sp. 96542]|nr:hypothetical protein [Leptospira sp. 96542]